MNTKAILSFIVATVIALSAINSVLAGTLNVTVNEVTVNDVVLGSGITLAGAAGETVPVEVQLTAASSLQDLKVKVWVEGYKSDVYASTARFDVLAGSKYIKRLSLTLPSVQDMEDPSEALTLYVSVADKNDEVENSYSVEMQRESYSVELLSVEAPSKASAGEIIGLDVVLKNTGLREAEDTFVTVSIPELGISRKAYFGDLTPTDDADEDKEDARERRVYLTIPADAKSGDYEVTVKASNYDTTSIVKKAMSITGLASSTTNSTGVIDTNGNKEAGMPTSIVVLTVVLVIIFVVLLVVLIVLLTKKPSDKVEDFGESYY